MSPVPVAFQQACIAGANSIVLGFDSGINAPKNFLSALISASGSAFPTPVISQWISSATKFSANPITIKYDDTVRIFQNFVNF